MTNGEHKPDLQPDRFTGDWWRAQFDGICHTVNLLAREQKVYDPKFAKLWRRIEEQDETIKALTLEIGQLKDRMDRAAGVVGKALRATGQRPEPEAKNGEKAA